MYKIAVIIQARLNSTRLPNKILLPISDCQNVTLIQYMVDRLKKKLDIPIIIAIPDNIENDKLAEHLELKKIDFYRGPQDDVLYRYLIGAKNYDLDVIIRLTSDCPLVDPYLVNEMLEYFLEKKVDYLSNTTPPEKSTFPDGSDIEIFSRHALEKANKETFDKKYREHVTFQFWDGQHKYTNKLYKQKLSYSHLRYTIDNKEDYELFLKLYDKLLKNQNFVSFENIQEYLNKNKSLQKINSKYKPGDNW